MIQFVLGALVGGGIVGILTTIVLVIDKGDDWYDI